LNGPSNEWSVKTLRRRVLYVQYTNPAAYPPLEHSSRLLARDRWDVLFVGTGALGADALEFPPHERIRVWRVPFCPPGFRQKAHYVLFAVRALTFALLWRPQWVYASDLLSCPIALLLSFLPGIRVVYHEHDSPVEMSGGPFVRLCLLSRKWVAHRARLCVLPNDRRVERFSRQTGRKGSIFCARNCPTREEVTGPRPSLNGGGLRVLYHGSIVPSRLPPAVLTALRALPPEVRLRIVGYETTGYPGYTRQIRALATDLGIHDRVEVIGPLPTRRELLERCRECQVGITLLSKGSVDPNEQWMTGASNKPFDYLASGLALLVSDLPDWRATYVDPGYGLACDPDAPESIAAALRWFLEHPNETREMGERGRQRVMVEWNYESEFAPVLDRMNADGRR